MEKKFIGLDWDSVSSGQTLVYSANTWVSSDELIILNSIVKTDGINTVTIGNSDDIYLSGKTYTNMLNLTGLTTQTGDTLLYIDNNGDVTKGELKSHTHLVSEITNLTLQDIALLSVSNEAELISAVTNINANYMSGTILFENSISLSNDLVINLNAITIDMNGFTLFQNGNIIDIYGQRWNLNNGSLKYDNTAWNNIVVHNNLGIKIEGGSGTTITYTIIGKFNNIRFENYIGVSGDTISISGDTNIEMPIYTGSDYAMSLVFDSCSFFSPTGNYDGVPEGSPQITFVPFVVKFGAANNGCSLSVYNHKTPYQQSGNYSKMIKFNVTADTDKIYYYSDSTIELANIEGTGIGEWTLDPSAALSNGQIAKMSNGTAAFITDRHVLPSGKTDTTILVSSSGYLYKQNLDSLNYISLTGGTVTGNLILSGSTSGLVMNNITITGITEDLLTSATENQFATAKSIKTYVDSEVDIATAYTYNVENAFNESVDVAAGVVYKKFAKILNITSTSNTVTLFTIPTSKIAFMGFDEPKIVIHSYGSLATNDAVVRLSYNSHAGGVLTQDISLDKMSAAPYYNVLEIAAFPKIMGPGSVTMSVVTAGTNGTVLIKGEVTF